ncbi:choline transporter protein 1-like [Primulina tabacum]|uniref:choline transporter protein 1-like n=1 Tax=Primulina tabacum TaxID=48773 RepID=UPI003F5AB74C
MACVTSLWRISAIVPMMIRCFVSGMPSITVTLFSILIVSVTMFYYLKAGWLGHDAISPIIGCKSSSCGCCPHDRCDDYFSPTFYCYSPSRTYGNLCPQGCCEGHWRYRGNDNFPIISYAILAIFYMFWLSAALHLFSSGSVIQNDCEVNCCAYDLKAKQKSCNGYKVHYTSHIFVAILFHLFGGFWATQFIVAFSSTFIAGSVALNYWARGETLPHISFLPVFSSMKRLAGSIALGSLLVTFIESTRFILEALRQRLKRIKSMPQSRFEKMVHHTSPCCLRCIGWFIKHVNHHASWIFWTISN